jgi:sterol desaturase/sphingolipid hydroxylase (fatty acid hydroxylase superfamily)
MVEYLIQTPELHPVRHQIDVHAFNFGDLPIRDRLLESIAIPTSLPRDAAFRVTISARLLLFQDVYDR